MSDTDTTGAASPSAENPGGMSAFDQYVASRQQENERLTKLVRETQPTSLEEVTKMLLAHKAEQEKARKAQRAKARRDRMKAADRKDAPNALFDLYKEICKFLDAPDCMPSFALQEYARDQGWLRVRQSNFLGNMNGEGAPIPRYRHVDTAFAYQALVSILVGFLRDHRKGDGFEFPPCTGADRQATDAAADMNPPSDGTAGADRSLPTPRSMQS